MWKWHGITKFVSQSNSLYHYSVIDLILKLILEILIKKFFHNVLDKSLVKINIDKRSKKKINSLFNGP